jgi:tRNA G18 (ribose-2'-O)-methylase SpoU
MTSTLRQFPPIFKRLDSSKNKFVQHFIRLRENKQYRTEQNAVIVQGLKTIHELRQDGVPIHSLAVTAEKQPPSESMTHTSTLQILQNPNAFEAKHNYLVDHSLTRRILGTASRPGRHEVFAEIPIPPHSLPPKEDIDRLVVFNHIMDPGNLGNLVRTGKALGWGSGVVVTGGTCDLYNDKTIRASRALTLRWNFQEVDSISGLLALLTSYDMTPLVADMIPVVDKVGDLWSPMMGDTYPGGRNVGSGPWLWNFGNKERKLPKRPALILSSEHCGVQGLEDQIRISVPMAPGVESLNVASAGGLLMNELNRLINYS